jgi:pyruvate dehydrogenase E2 component (dihydrolipoamide acetyltransferase)
MTVILVDLQKQSWTMEEGKIVRWIKKLGDRVEKGEELLEIETEKATAAIESPGSGLIRKILASEGETVNVGSVLAIIAEADEDITRAVPGIPSAKPKSTVIPPEEQQSNEKNPVRETVAQTSSGRISPRAKKLAADLGVDLLSVKSTGPMGSIVESDIRGAAKSKFPLTVVKKIPLTGTRKLIADRMMSSLNTKAQVTITMEVDVTEIEKLREKLTYDAIVCKAAAVALRNHPDLNSLTVDDEVRVIKEINVGLAVSTDSGLVVPVIKSADFLGLEEIDSLVHDRVRAARDGSLRIEDVSDGTFTITNLGVYGIDVNTAIINPPQNAILSFGRIAEKPVVLNSKIEIRSIATFGLSFDHKVIDGAPAAKYLQEVKSLLENPALLG